MLPNFGCIKQGMQPLVQCTHTHNYHNFREFTKVKYVRLHALSSPFCGGSISPCTYMQQSHHHPLSPLSCGCLACPGDSQLVAKFHGSCHLGLQKKVSWFFILCKHSGETTPTICLLALWLALANAQGATLKFHGCYFRGSRSIHKNHETLNHVKIYRQRKTSTISHSLCLVAQLDV